MSQTITLSFPVSVAGRSIAEVTLRRPKAGDLRAMDKKANASEFEKSLWMIGALAELSPAEVDALDAADFKALADAVAGFMSTAG